jgi:8-oxo-dGTP pyrophosphatase MutT (NUDIX family)
MRNRIRTEIASIIPLDELEQAHVADALAWIDSGAEICRIAKPATPPKHLVSYFACIDGDHILLVDHRNAGLWLPAGGHVEPGEHPRTTVIREAREELDIDVLFLRESPLMVTCTETVGATAGHVDVSLWYVIAGNHAAVPWFDRSEFNAVRWFSISDIPLDRTDPHMSRFLRKYAALRSR